MKYTNYDMNAYNLHIINTNKFKYCIDYTDSLNYSLKNAIGDLYFAVYFDLDYKYIDELRKRGIKIWK